MCNECLELEGGGVIRPHLQYLAAKRVGLREAAGLAVGLGGREDY